MHKEWKTIGTTTGRTAVIDNSIYSMSVRKTAGGAECLLQRGSFDGQWGRFDNYVKFGKADHLEEAYERLNWHTLRYASEIHGVDLSDWQIGFDDTIEAYGKVVELGDREHVIEIRQLGETSADWMIEQGDEYDGVRNRFDHHISKGETSNLAASYEAVIDLIEAYTPPTPHVF